MVSCVLFEDICYTKVHGWSYVALNYWYILTLEIVLISYRRQMAETRAYMQLGCRCLTFCHPCIVRDRYCKCSQHTPQPECKRLSDTNGIKSLSPGRRGCNFGSINFKPQRMNRWCGLLKEQLPCLIYSLAPSDGTWWYWTSAELVKVMTCCLTPQSPYQPKCWRISSEVLWYTHIVNLAGDISNIKIQFEYIYICLRQPPWGTLS